MRRRQGGSSSSAHRRFGINLIKQLLLPLLMAGMIESDWFIEGIAWGTCQRSALFEFFWIFCVCVCENRKGQSGANANANQKRPFCVCVCANRKDRPKARSVKRYFSLFWSLFWSCPSHLKIDFENRIKTPSRSAHFWGGFRSIFKSIFKREMQEYRNRKHHLCQHQRTMTAAVSSCVRSHHDNKNDSIGLNRR